MANWESHRPPRTSSRWQPPGIFLNVEFGVSFSSNDRTHRTGIKYTSRRMEERLHEERMRRQREAGYFPDTQPSELQQLATLGALMPGFEEAGGHEEYYQPERQTRRQQQQWQRQLGISTREQHQRGTSAPPSLTDRNQSVSPPVNYIPHIAPIQHTQSMPLERTSSQSPLTERTNQPLPPTPSQFRLGEDDMPWSMPAFYRSPDLPHPAVSFDAGLVQESRHLLRSPEQPNPANPFGDRMSEEGGRIEDPQRVRQMEALHQAMMTVDSLPIGHDELEPWTWNSVGDMPRGPRSIGWAISSRDTPSGSQNMPLPPPYVVSQWEELSGESRYGRPRSAYS